MGIDCIDTTDRSAQHEPDVLSISHTPESLVIELEVPADLIYFRGHFPDEPVLPGVVELLWVQNYAAKWIGRSPWFKDMDRVKFTSLIRPHDRLRLEIAALADRSGVSYRYLRDGETVGSGQLMHSADVPET